MSFNWKPYVLEIIKSSTETCDLPKKAKRAELIAKEIFGKNNVELHTDFDFLDLNYILDCHFRNTYFNYDGEKSLARIEQMVNDNGLAGPSLLIRIPRRVVSNEVGDHTTIENLFIWVQLYKTGNIRSFNYLKTSYTRAQYIHNYIHSHCPRLDKAHPQEWKNVCMGTGPIRETLRRCNIDSTDVNMKCFFMELSKIIEVESLTGGPYIRMAELNNNKKTSNLHMSYMSGNHSGLLKKFIASYLHTDRLKLFYDGQTYCIPCDFIDWLRDFTDYFIKWSNIIYETKPMFKLQIKTICRTLINDIKVQDNVFMDDSSEDTTWHNSYERTKDMVLVRFNNEDYKLRIIDSDEKTVHTERLFNPNLAINILHSILQTVNYCHNKLTKDEYKALYSKSEQEAQWQIATNTKERIYNTDARIS